MSLADGISVRAALQHILESAPFRSTHQCQALLTYIVVHTLTGEGDKLRERVIGNVVLGRPADYEPSEDPIVRVRVADVRKRLAQYYQDRTDSPLRIEVPPGSYRAVFQTHTSQPIAASDKFGRTSLLIMLALLAAIGSGILLPALTRRHAPSALDQFWAPALASPKPILIYNATTTVFRSSDPGDPSHDSVPVRGQYTCIGDAYASVVLGSLLSHNGKLYQMRYGADLTFGDLRFQPSILIGAFNNAWTLQTTSNLRFVFDKHPTIRDRSDNRLYTLPNMMPDGRTPEDYAIVSRLFDSKTGELLIAAGGITQYGTRAAGEFLTSPRLMAALAARAPGGWPKRNLQVLIHTKIVDDMPSLPDIVATCFW